MPLLDRFTKLIIDPTILLVFTAGFLLFLWGLVVFITGLGDDARGNAYQTGKQHMMWGLIGMLVMISVFGILTLINNTFNLGLSSDGRSYEPDMTRLNNITAPNIFGN